MTLFAQLQEILSRYLLRDLCPIVLGYFSHEIELKDFVHDGGAYSVLQLFAFSEEFHVLISNRVESFHLPIAGESISSSPLHRSRSERSSISHVFHTSYAYILPFDVKSMIHIPDAFQPSLPPLDEETLHNGIDDDLNATTSTGTLYAFAQKTGGFNWNLKYQFAQESVGTDWMVRVLDTKTWKEVFRMKLDSRPANLAISPHYVAVARHGYIQVQNWINQTQILIPMATKKEEVVISMYMHEIHEKHLVLVVLFRRQGRIYLFWCWILL